MLDTLLDEPRLLTEINFRSLRLEAMVTRDRPELMMQLSFKINAAKQNLHELQVESSIVFLALQVIEGELKAKLPDFLGTTRRLPTCKELVEFLQWQHAVYTQCQKRKSNANQNSRRLQGQSTPPATIWAKDKGVIGPPRFWQRLRPQRTLRERRRCVSSVVNLSMVFSSVQLLSTAKTKSNCYCLLSYAFIVAATRTTQRARDRVSSAPHAVDNKNLTVPVRWDAVNSVS